MTNVAISPPPSSRLAAGELRAATPKGVGVSANEGADVMSTRAAEKPGGETSAEERATVVPREELTETVEHLNGLMQVIRRELHFQIDDRSGRTVITVVDAETKEVIRHIPPEEVANIAHYLDTLSGGWMTDVRA